MPVRRFLLSLLLLGFAATASAQLRVVSYNTLGKPDSPTADNLAQTIFGAIATTDRNGIAKRPDVIALQEQQAYFPSGSTVEDLAGALNALYGVSSYRADLVQSGFGGLRVATVYDSSTVDYLGSTLTPVGTRPGHRSHFRPVGYTSGDAEFYVYSVHLNAGSSSTRANEAANLRNNADQLGPNQNIIFAGDFNFGGGGETGYLTMFGAGNAQAFDPINRPNWSGLAGRDIHTQSTRVTNLPDGGVPGGMDDRFDFQLVTAELMDGEGLSYIGPTANGAADHSYHAFGNDGTTFNQAINANPAGRSQPVGVLNALHDFSDHLPVVADYQLPAVASLEVVDASPRVLVDQFGVAELAVANLAPVAVPSGADVLDYALDVTSGTAFLGPFQGSAAAASPANEHLFVFQPAASAGPQSVDFTLTSDNEGLNESAITRTIDFVAVDHANGSFSNSADVDLKQLTFGSVPAGQEALTLSFDLYNLIATPGYTADLVITDPVAVSGDTSLLDLSLAGPAEPIIAGESLALQAVLDRTTPGQYSATWQITVSDEPLPGAQSQTLTVELFAEVFAPVPGDANGDGAVDQGDLTILADHWLGAGEPTDGDFNGDGIVDVVDLGVLADNWQIGSSSSVGLAEALGRTPLPEPTSLALIGVGGVLLLRRRGPITTAR